MIEQVIALSEKEIDYLYDRFPEKEHKWLKDNLGTSVDGNFTSKLVNKIREVDFVTEVISYLTFDDEAREKARDLKAEIKDFSKDKKKLPLTNGTQRIFFRGGNKVANIESKGPDITIEFYNGYEKNFDVEFFKSRPRIF